MRSEFDLFIDGYDFELGYGSLLKDLLKFNKEQSFDEKGFFRPESLCEIWNTHPRGLPEKTVSDFALQDVLKTKNGVIALMKSSSTKEEWNKNCDKVKHANDRQSSLDHSRKSLKL